MHYVVCGDWAERHMSVAYFSQFWDKATSGCRSSFRTDRKWNQKLIDWMDIGSTVISTHDPWRTDSSKHKMTGPPSGSKPDLLSSSHTPKGKYNIAGPQVESDIYCFVLENMWLQKSVLNIRMIILLVDHNPHHHIGAMWLEAKLLPEAAVDLFTWQSQIIESIKSKHMGGPWPPNSAQLVAVAMQMKKASPSSCQ